MTTLQLIWFILVGLLFAIFFLLEGFDYGVGIANRLLGRDTKERSKILRAIGPHWDGNEVWLLTAGGAMFASFPFWYASLFSGFYVMLILILLALILRGVSFEFSSHVRTDKARGFWQWVTAIASFAAPFIFGMLFIDLVRGMPIDAKGDIYAGFGDYVNLFSIVGGVAVSLLSLLHGLNFLRLKFKKDEIGERATKLAKVLYPVLFAGLVVFAVLLYIDTDFFANHLIETLALLVAIVGASVVATYGAYMKKAITSFVASGLTLMLVVVLLFVGLFPRVMVANDSANDILIANASSTPYTLSVMTVVVVIFVPIVLAYTIWSYVVLNKKPKPVSSGE
jgi:cytochrome d ubiquinol oxidase subunit II